MSKTERSETAGWFAITVQVEGEDGPRVMAPYKLRERADVMALALNEMAVVAEVKLTARVIDAEPPTSQKQNLAALLAKIDPKAEAKLAKAAKPAAKAP